MSIERALKLARIIEMELNKASLEHSSDSLAILEELTTELEMQVKKQLDSDTEKECILAAKQAV